MSEPISIVPLPVLKDNYIWLICDAENAVVVDPAESTPVLAFLTKNRLKLTACLLTHNHHDHTDGVADLKAVYPDLPVYGSRELEEFAEQIVQGGDRFSLANLQIEVLDSPGHTAAHISYLVNGEYLFCGDALFSGGCGRVFTGDYQAQFETLQRFKVLPDFVQIYAGHEYTATNLRFADSVLPPSCVRAEYQERAELYTQQKRPTLPSSIGIEKQINPFLQAVDLAEFIAMRRLRDQF